MKHIWLILMLATAAVVPVCANPFAGRWDLTVTTAKESYPDWMELVEKDGKPEVRVQPRGGSVHPVASSKMDGSKLLLVVSKATARRPEVTWESTVNGDRITGTQKS